MENGWPDRQAEAVAVAPTSRRTRPGIRSVVGQCHGVQFHRVSTNISFSFAKVSRSTAWLDVWGQNPVRHPEQDAQSVPEWPMQSAWRDVHRADYEEGQSTFGAKRTCSQKANPVRGCKNPLFLTACVRRAAQPRPTRSAMRVIQSDALTA